MNTPGSHIMNWLRLPAVLLGALLVAGPAIAATATKPAAAQKEEVAILAGGCFWCSEADLEKLPGVSTVVSGYSGGRTVNPSYEQVSSGGTGHTEVVEVRFDPTRLSYAALLDYFWRHIDPTVKDQQFCDYGSQYRSAIYTIGPEQARIAAESKAKLEASKVLDAPIQTEIRAAGPFYPAEEYHQDYYKKNPVRYNYYRFGCGRDARLKKVWARDPSQTGH